MTDMALLGTPGTRLRSTGLAAPSPLRTEVLGFKTEGGHRKDKGSNVEGKEILEKST